MFKVKNCSNFKNCSYLKTEKKMKQKSETEKMKTEKRKTKKQKKTENPNKTRLKQLSELKWAAAHTAPRAGAPPFGRAHGRVIGIRRITRSFTRALGQARVS